jgi:hypothetical protein
LGYRAERLSGGIHYVPATDAVDMRIYKAGYSGHAAGVNFSGAGRRGYRVAAAHRGNLSVFDDYRTAGNFFQRSEQPVGDQHQAGHASSYFINSDYFKNSQAPIEFPLAAARRSKINQQRPNHSFATG